MKSIKIPLLITLAVLFICAANPAGNRYLLSKNYTVTIKGTSNIHNWNETVGDVFGDGWVSWNADGSFDLNAINLKMQVTSIKSDMGSIMNNNTYRALKAEYDPQIIFTLATPVKSIQSGSVATIVSAKGILTIAGATRPIDIQLKVSAPNHMNLTFEGSQTVMMTDYNISPPTALLGTLRTGNEITINFNTVFTIIPN